MCSGGLAGRSTSTFKVEGGKGVFDGVCRIVPRLKAPGFCNAEARPRFGQKVPDASAFIEGGLELELVSTGNLTQFKARSNSDLKWSVNTSLRTWWRRESIAS